MSEYVAQEIGHLPASLCGSLADPHQIQILYALGKAEQTVGQLAGSLALSVQDVRRHLLALCQSRLVVADYSWPTAQYRLSDRRLMDALDILRAVIQDTLPDPAGLALLRPYLWTQPEPGSGC